MESVANDKSDGHDSMRVNEENEGEDQDISIGNDVSC